jgi:hypothetical protein
MIKFYKYRKDFAPDEWVTRQTSAKRWNNNTSELVEIPKGMRYFKIDKGAIIAEYINKLQKAE